jgi:hypothetical protein
MKQLQNTRPEEFSTEPHTHVDKDRKAIARFESAVTPESAEVTGAIEKALR